MHRQYERWLLFTSLAFFLLPTTAWAKDLDEHRKQLAHKPRSIIYNNDGTDIAEEFFSKQEYLQRRFVGMEDTEVDSVFFCDGVFDMYAHRSESSQAWPDWITRLHKQGEDPLQYAIEYCREHDLEIFWSMRMNDIHDSWAKSLFGSWKDQHRRLLMAPDEMIFPYGRAWTTLDYAQQEVRAKVLSIIEEVCRNYDIDGIELDFNRHDVYFKPTMLGSPAEPEHMEMMTRLMTDIRKMTERIAAERNRPLLIAIRTADSIEYCRETGIDIVRWLEQDLFDLWVVAGFFQLNPWEESIDLGHAHDVPVYPCLSRTRIPRDNQEAWRGEAYLAWQAGADGIYTFNMYDPAYQMYHEIHDPAVLQNLPRQAQYDLNVKFHHINSTVKANVIAAITFLRGVPERFLSKEVMWRIYPFLAPGKRLLVPREYPTIQAAIKKAQPHDELWIVHTHREEGNAFSLQKNLTLVSCDEAYDRIFPGAQWQLESFTIDHPEAEFIGIEFSTTQSEQPYLVRLNNSARFRSCAFICNKMPTTGLIGFSQAEQGQTVSFENCRFVYHGERPAISSLPEHAKRQEAVFINCLFEFNGSHDVAINAESSAWWHFYHCTIFDTAEDVTVAAGKRGSMLTFTNCIVHAPNGESLAFDTHSTMITSSHNLINAHTAYQGFVHDKRGDITDQEPHFAEDWDLTTKSPAVNAGIRLYDPFVPYDLRGTIRDTRSDMGCYEYRKQ